MCTAETTAKLYEQLKEQSNSFIKRSFSPCHTSVRQQAIALVSSHTVNASSLVEAGVGGAFIDVSLAVRSYSDEIRKHA